MKKYSRNFVPILLIFVFCLSGCRKKPQTEALVIERPKTEEVEEPKKKEWDVEASEVFPMPVGYVNDFSFLLNYLERKKLDEFLTSYEVETSNEIAVVTLDDVPSEQNIADFARDLANHWGVGKAGKNNGLVLLINRSKNEVSIQTGEGTQEKISDDFLKSVIDSLMFPRFVNGEIYEGIMAGLDEIIKKWE